jgi:HSP20 family protein
MLPVLRDVTSPLTAFEPFNRIDALFDRFFGGDGGVTRPSWSSWTTWAGLPVAMWEDDDHIYVEAELPGVAEKDVEVTVHNGMLYIRGERKPEEGRRYLYNGRVYGRFERVIALPESVDPNSVEAKLANGLLHVACGKNPDSKPRRITLQSS